MALLGCIEERALSLFTATVDVVEVAVVLDGFTTDVALYSVASSASNLVATILFDEWVCTCKASALVP
jgi:hypothetical protein